MRKKYLIKQNMSLYEEIQNYKFELVRLNKLIKEKDDTIASLSKQSDEVVHADVPEKDEKIFNETGDMLSEEIAGEIPQKTVPESVDTPNSPEVREVVFDDVTEYGAEIIGELVIASAEYSNKLTENNNSSHRDLLNLILGRTEVAKSEILGIVSAQSPFEEKKASMDDIKANVLEYFESVMAQI